MTTLRAEIPNAGDSIAMDVKHICAWVRENNPREDTLRAHRFDPACQPKRFTADAAFDAWYIYEHIHH